MILSDVIFGIIIISLVIERFLYSKEMNKQVRELSKLVKSKDALEYVQVQKIEEEDRKSEKEESEYVPSEGLSDDQFFNLITKQDA